MEVLRSLSSWNPYVMEDAELLKDLIGPGQAAVVRRRRWELLPCVRRRFDPFYST